MLKIMPPNSGFILSDLRGKQTAPVGDCTEQGAALAVACTITLHATSLKLYLWTSHAKLELYAKPAATASSGSPGRNNIKLHFGEKVVVDLWDGTK